MSEHIALDACKARHLYAVHARNFSVAVFDGNTGFIGRRIKFGDACLFTEEHWDMGAPFGTVKPIRDLGEVDGDVYVDDGSASLLEFLTNRSCHDPADNN